MGDENQKQKQKQQGEKDRANVISEDSVKNNCDNKSGDNRKNVTPDDNRKNRDTGIVQKNGQGEKTDEVIDMYVDSDKGPYIVHLSEKMKTDKEIAQDIHDVIIGLKLKKLKVKGISEIKKVSRRELKVIFTNKELANEFLSGRSPKDLGVNAYIPKYNVTKVGIIFDIPTKFSEADLMDNLESELPIMEVYRCQKRKVENGNKTRDWIPANTIKVTFRGQSVPDEVIFGFSKRKVKPDVHQRISVL